MPISFACKSCGKRLKAPDSAAGKTSKCPQCHGPVTCPKPVRTVPAVEEPEAPEILDDVDPYADMGDTNPYAAPKAREEDDLADGPALGRASTGVKKKKKRKYAGYAGFWARFAAVFIDGIILTVAVNLPIQFLMGSAVTPAAPGQPPQIDLQRVMILNLISILINLAYFAGMESSSYQGTLGKMALGIQVTDLQGHRISLPRAIGRWFAKQLSFLLCFIGFIMAGFTEKNQALHDKIAGTLVVR